VVASLVAAGLSDDIRTPRVCAGLHRWPTLEARKQVRPAPLEPFWHAQTSGRQETIAHRMAAIQDAVPLTPEPAVRPAAGRLRNACATPMNTTMAASHAGAHALEQRCRTPADDHLLAALPGAGTVDAARSTAALGPGRDRWTPVDARRGCAGVAPGLARRGKSTGSSGRSCCPQCLRPSGPAYAGESLHHACWARADDMSPRARGTSHQAAVSAWACQGIRILSTCWPTRPPYSAVTYWERLRRKGAPLLACAANTPS
jgi:hypothetical protein